ncbi:hypothetical protein SAMN05421839_10630 [Halolactibacillus halophilus]|uniref:Uncharacterized protein n=1 Tax=Halolactibacillus halophilus TaxID=306540 RepID=A0A1I5MQ95_9BACI|nr:hypothetical protein [Halolactibacillus halophilus]GEM02522.1 hypothetical protein HHA03_20540 [Halolactibacillus halophilus]SFP11086.1 hypothetical protein SAMN05421839_10630 [Halolactibacillus halophilus]
MKVKEFENGLVIKHRKSAIIFENAEGKKEKEERFVYRFSSKEFKVFTDYIKKIANESWTNIAPKEAHSMGSDYDEYYDHRYDDNGYLSLLDDGISIRAPYWSVDTLYQFNKAKIQSFIYDLDQKLLRSSSKTT